MFDFIHNIVKLLPIIYLILIIVSAIVLINYRKDKKKFRKLVFKFSIIWGAIILITLLILAVNIYLLNYDYIKRLESPL